MILAFNGNNFPKHHSAAVLCIGYAVLSARQEINSYVVFKPTPVLTKSNELSF